MGDEIAQSVQWATGWMTEGNLVRFQAKERHFVLLQRIQPDFRAHPASYSMETTGASTAG
jgi:hypothetical protein